MPNVPGRDSFAWLNTIERYAVKKPLLLCSLALTVGSVGCRGDKDVEGGPDGGSTGGQTIQEVQDESMPVGTAVTLNGVVVVAVDTFGGRKGGIYVMEPEGGPFSGVFVFLEEGGADGLAVGDLVDITGGVKDEFALSDDDSGRTLTEVSPPDGSKITVTKVGTGTVPEPELLLPQELAADEDEAEKWEGVLIRFETVRALNAPRGATMSDMTLEEFRITGPFIVQSSLAKFPAGIVRDDCLDSITGIGDYFFDYKVLPRSTSDIATSGSGCLPLEENDALCGNGDDDDFNGFADCQDLGCIDALAACPPTDATVEEIQTSVAAGTRVRVMNRVVTAVDDNSMGTDFIWISDALAGKENAGVAVVVPEGELPTGIVVGSRVELTASVVEFKDQLTELENPVFASVMGTGTPTPLMGMNPLLVGDAVTGEPFEGVLVRLENVKVVSADAGFGMITVGDETNPLFVDDNMVAKPSNTAVGLCFDNLTGVMHWNPNEQKRTLLPRSAADFDSVGGSCN